VAVFFSFVGFVVWAIIDRELQIKSLKDSRPLIEVKPNGLSLEVENKGAAAKFSADVKIHDKTFQRVDEQYAGYWQKAKSYETEIWRDKSDSILIASMNRFPDQPGLAIANDAVAKTLELFYYDFNTGSIKSWKSSTYIQAGFKMPPQTFPQYELKVTITAKPELTKKFTRCYMLDITGLYETSRQEDRVAHK
jgi:hypothetical protein